MDTKALRQKILDLAIRGKLVPQDPNDEPASVLLERIRAEKERLIVEGKIKRPKKSKASSSESHYRKFEIPNSWEWVKLEDVCLIITDGDHQAPPKADNGIPFLVISDIIKGKINFDNCRFVPSSYYTSLPEERKAIRGDILFTVTGSYGVPIRVETDIKFCFQRHIGLIKPIIIGDWINLFLQSGHCKKYCDKKATGTAQKTVGLQSLRELEISIPPLEEQIRIVNSLNVLTSEIATIENSTNCLRSVTSTCKSKILEFAMQGKLVPQDPTDEPAATMLRRVNPKARIITDNPHSRNMPDGWCESDLKSIGKWQSGATPSKLNHLYYGKGYPWLNTGDLNDGYITKIPKEITETALQETSVKLNPAGSVLIAMYGATIGKLGILTFPSTTNQACCACADCYIFNKYLFYFLRHYRTRFIEMGGGGAQPNISKEKIESTIMSVPPLSEQQRIVERIESVYSVLDEIEASLQS